MFSRYKSLLGSNFHFCVSRFNFSESAFLDNKIYVTHMVKKHCFNMRDDNRLSIARFMHESISLRDMVEPYLLKISIHALMVGRYGNWSLLSKDELNCIVNYLATY